MKTFLPQTPKEAILADALCWIITAAIISMISLTAGANIAAVGTLAIGAELYTVHRRNKQILNEDNL